MRILSEIFSHVFFVFVFAVGWSTSLSSWRCNNPFHRQMREKKTKYANVKSENSLKSMMAD